MMTNCMNNALLSFFNCFREIARTKSKIRKRVLEEVFNDYVRAQQHGRGLAAL